MLILVSGCSNWGNQRSTASINSDRYDVDRPFTIDSSIDCCEFPLSKRSLVPIDNSSLYLQFGARRRNGRLKSSVSIVGLNGESVKAIADGTILNNPSSYHPGATDQYIAVKSKGLIIGYGGLKLNHLRRGDKVEKGQSLGILISPPKNHPLSRSHGRIKSLILDNNLSDDQRIAMLYIHMFVEREGVSMEDPIRNHSLPYRKRKDLVNPTHFLKDLEDSLD